MFKDQIMFKDKYPSIFSHQIGAIVFIFFQIYSPVLVADYLVMQRV